jgi:hypothetical protein
MMALFVLFGLFFPFSSTFGGIFIGAVFSFTTYSIDGIVFLDFPLCSL